MLFGKKQNEESAREIEASRMAIFDKVLETFNGLRNVWKALGWKEELAFEDFYLYYKRHGIARTVVKAFPESCWLYEPAVSENEEPQYTVFEQAWLDLEEKHSLYSVLERADILSGIGAYGVILMGFNDGKSLDQPAAAAAGMRLTYVRPMHQGLASIASYEIDSKNPRYGKPATYLLKIKDGAGFKTQTVHWSRIIHIAEDCDDGDTWGTPRMEAVYNNLQEIEKIYGAAGEGYWRGAYPGISVNFQGGEPEPSIKDKMKQVVSDFVHGFKRFIMLGNSEIKTLTPTFVSPKDAMDAQLQVIAGEKRIPKRILVGSEEAQLAGEQDDNAFNKAVDKRRQKYAGPYILKRFIDRLIELKVLPETVGGYEITWPDLRNSSDKEKAEIAKIRAEALKTYFSEPQLQMEYPFREFLHHVMGYELVIVDAICNNAAKSGLEPVRTTDGEVTSGNNNPTGQTSQTGQGGNA